MRSAAERGGLLLVDRKRMSGLYHRDAVSISRGSRRHLSGNDVGEDASGCTREWLAEASAGGRLDTDRVSRLDRQIGEVCRQPFFTRRRRIHQEASGPAGFTAVKSRRADDLTQAAADKSSIR